jgi:tRNA-dihydrouridine synthase B
MPRDARIGETGGKMKQFASWFTHGVPGGAGLRKAIYEAREAPEILKRVEEFFEKRLGGVDDAAGEIARPGSTTMSTVVV